MGRKRSGRSIWRIGEPSGPNSCHSWRPDAKHPNPDAAGRSCANLVENRLAFRKWQVAAPPRPWIALRERRYDILLMLRE